MNQLKVGFYTLGCKVNQNDTESLMSLFRQRGYEIVPFGAEADICVVNTCAVTQTGASKSRQMIRKAIGFEPEVVVATGCYPQVAAAEVGAITGVNLVVGMEERPKIVDLVEEYLQRRENRLQLQGDAQGSWIELPIEHASHRTRATLKVEEGCEQFCSYCIVPYARGKVRSMPLEQAVAGFRHLVASGFKEIVLTGIHIGSYGKDLGLTLAQLLASLLETPGDYRIRLGSIEPLDFDDTLLDLVLTHPKICPYFHIPLQSGSNEILKQMNRHYDRAYYQGLLRYIRKGNPLAGIGTDLIVGFPGETEVNFRETVDFVQRQAFSRMHVFRYSPRKGTPAATLPGRISRGIQEDRSQAILKIAAATMREFAAKFIGREVSVLFEESETGGWTGLSGEYLRVYLPTEENLKNQLIRVIVDRIEGELLVARLI